jgi:hypothetical protein
MKSIFTVTFFVGALIGALEISSFFALKLFPTGNPLAYSSKDASLHYYLPMDGWHYYTIAPDHHQTLKNDEYETSISINSMGLRESEEVVGKKIDVGFVGDSFTFGYGVNYGERYSDELRRRDRKLVVASFGGRNGFTTPHYYLFMKNNPELMPKTLVVGLFPWNDFRGDISSHEFVYDVNGALVATKSTSKKVLDDGYLAGIRFEGNREPAWRTIARETNLGRTSLLAWSRIKRFLALRDANTHVDEGGSTKDHDLGSAGHIKRKESIEFGVFDANAILALEYLDKLNALMKFNGGNLVVLYIPASYIVGDYMYFCNYSSGYSDEECRTLAGKDLLGKSLRNWFEQKNIHYVNPVSEFRKFEAKGKRAYYLKDGHWKPSGHALAGNIVYDYLVSKGMLD